MGMHLLKVETARKETEMKQNINQSKNQIKNGDEWIMSKYL